MSRGRGRRQEKVGDWKWFMCFLSNNHSFITYWKLKTALQVSLFQGRYFCLHRGCMYCILDYSCYSGGTIRALPHFELEFSANHPKFVIMKTLPYCFATWNVPFFWSPPSYLRCLVLTTKLRLCFCLVVPFSFASLVAHTIMGDCL